MKVLSTDPTGITLSADDVCPATSVDLTVTGGTLGTGGVWEWSTVRCSERPSIMELPSVVTPLYTTTYYVRANDDCGTSGSVGTKLTVKVLSTDPTGITLSADDVCPATSVDLTVTGGTLGTGGVWEWSTVRRLQWDYFDNGVTISVSPLVPLRLTM